ncbi:MAG TPA: hypothetical protein VEF04_12910, partial [Blastocatellia bacterium]|nr:hypothetical protein [Blastocatellia bacterium]
ELFALRLTEFQNLYETSFAFTEGTSLKSCLTLFNSFLDRLRRNFDLILIDAPAATKCPATARISVQCDGTILVAREGATSEQSIEEVYELFESSLAEVIGVVMNHCRANEEGVQGVSLLQEAA